VFRKLAVLALALLFFSPATLLLAVGVLMNPAANAACSTPGSLSVGAVPDSLRVTTADGSSFTVNKTQLTHAATIITVGDKIDGVGRPGVKIALMAALTESTLRMLANTGTYPESGNYPNDGNGGDHDSLGLFQMRPQSGWGTVAELMDPTYQARAFFGGPTGPNHGSPRGLLDIPGWQTMDPGEAAQSVEVSAFPDRYRNNAPVADAILNALTNTSVSRAGSAAGGTTVAADTSRVVFPLPARTWVLASPFGPRIHPITGEASFHTGTDFAAPEGTPILAAADGVVTVAGPVGGYGNLIVIEHHIDGQTVATAYGHTWDTGVLVHVGDRVTAGQHIGDVGSAGMSTGPHLHFEVRPGGTNGTAIDAAAWLTQHGAANLPAATTGPTTGCGAHGATAVTWPVPAGPITAALPRGGA
jgi:murein DD-endopeptidase MepM/ murein hydrolase activator NlpD